MPTPVWIGVGVFALIAIVLADRAYEWWQSTWLPVTSSELYSAVRSDLLVCNYDQDVRWNESGFERADAVLLSANGMTVLYRSYEDCSCHRWERIKCSMCKHRGPFEFVFCQGKVDRYYFENELVGSREILDSAFVSAVEDVTLPGIRQLTGKVHI